VSIEWLLERFHEWPDRDAIIWEDREYSYAWLLEKTREWQGELDRYGVTSGSVVAIDGDYSPSTAALLLALIDRGTIVTPLTSSVAANRAKFIETADVEISFEFGESDDWQVERFERSEAHPLMKQLSDEGIPGLVLFSSGSTGESKAALHDFSKLLEKFEAKRNTLRTLTFLLFDHIGGINTLFYTLSNGGTVISVQNRSPAAVCRAIEQHKAELLPTSPTFLNLLLVSEQYEEFDLSSLKLITYGTEVMPEYTLARLNELFPDVRLQQTYGLSEVGILRSRSRDSSSLWVKLGGEGFETRIEDGTFWIRARGAMLGYLNAPSPFTEDGWFNTGDRVEVDGEYVKFLGRDSEIINVGGEKVWPAEVESVLMGVENIAEAWVRGEKHPFTGEVVVAEVVLKEPESALSVKRRVRQICAPVLERYKIPVKVTVTNVSRAGARFKKIRREVAPA